MDVPSKPPNALFFLPTLFPDSDEQETLCFSPSFILVAMENPTLRTLPSCGSHCNVCLAMEKLLQEAYNITFNSQRCDSNTSEKDRMNYVSSAMHWFNLFWVLYYSYVVTCESSLFLPVKLHVAMERVDPVSLEIKSPIHVNHWKIKSCAFKLLVEHLLYIFSKSQEDYPGSSKEEYSTYVSLMISVAYIMTKYSYRMEKDFDILSTGISDEQYNLLVQIADLHFFRLMPRRDSMDLYCFGLHLVLEVYLTFVSEYEATNIVQDGCSTMHLSDECRSFNQRRKNLVLTMIIEMDRLKWLSKFLRAHDYAKVASKISQTVMKKGGSGEKCEFCLKREQISTPRFGLCGRCKVVKYCCEDCKNKHWPTHKKLCTKRTCREDINALTFGKHVDLRSLNVALRRSFAGGVQSNLQ